MPEPIEVTNMRKNSNNREYVLEAVVGEKIADNIEAARKGKMKINAGGGGVYGKVTKE